MIKASIDIEVAMRGEAIDVGVFGPTALLDSNAADKLLARLKEGMSELLVLK